MPVESLRRAEFEPLWRAVHERLSSGLAVRRVRVGPLDPAQREAVARLLGSRQLPGEHVSISLEQLDSALLELCGRDARGVVRELLGPLRDREQERLREQEERAALWEWLTRHPVVEAQPALREWAEQLRRGGLLTGSPAATGEMLDGALRVLHALPAFGASPREFANAVLGDPRALDQGTPLSGLVLRALSEVQDHPLPISSEQRRELLVRSGLGEDVLSTVVYAAGVRPSGGGLAGEILRACAESAHVAALTLAQVRDAERLSLGVGEVWVVQEPVVLALALRRFGRLCPPVVCTSGWPNSAVVLLLRRLSESGAVLHFRGSFDGAGVRIAAHLMAKTRARPWRMSAADYVEALDHDPSGGDVGRVTEAPWDAALAPALREHRTAVPQPRTAPALLDEAARRTL